MHVNLSACAGLPYHWSEALLWGHAWVCVHEHETGKMLQSSVAASLLWKWIVGILYLSMPPFGPWNARAYFPIMALSCSQLPREPRCSLHSALLTPFFTCVCVCVWRGRWGGKKGASVLYSVMMSERWWGTVIMQSLLFSLCTGGIVSCGRSYSLKLWNMTQPIACVCARACVCPEAKPTDLLWSFCSNSNSYSLLRLAGHIYFEFFYSSSLLPLF